MPRVGSASGLVAAPVGSSPTNGIVGLQRTDGQYAISADVRADRRWQMPAVPAGTYIALVRAPNATLVGEAIHDLPFDISGATPYLVRLTRLLDAGALVYTVSPATATVVGNAELVAPGALKGVVADLDGSLADVTVTWRHSSGYVVATGPAPTTAMSHTIRPGGYTLCATEGATTLCSGGASSCWTATPVVVTSGTVTTTVTLP